jgi:hypothetical protein
VFSLGCLAWLFYRLPAERLMVALIGLMPRTGRAGSAGERLTVRLWLVMELLQDEQNRPGWRQMLDAHAVPPGLPDSLCVTLPVWRPADVCLAAVIGAAGFALAIVG